LGDGNRGVGEAIAELLAVDVAVCDRAGLGAAVKSAQRVRGWVDAVDVAIARRSRELAAEGRSESAAEVLSGHGRRSTRETKAVSDRSLCSKHHHLVREGRWRLTLDQHRVVTMHRPDGKRHFRGSTINRTGRGPASATARASEHEGGNAHRDVRNSQRPTARAAGPP
jgi:hypothetical protein